MATHPPPPSAAPPPPFPPHSTAHNTLVAPRATNPTQPTRKMKITRAFLSVLLASPVGLAALLRGNDKGVRFLSTDDAATLAAPEKAVVDTDKTYYGGGGGGMQQQQQMNGGWGGGGMQQQVGYLASPPPSPPTCPFVHPPTHRPTHLPTHLHVPPPTHRLTNPHIYSSNKWAACSSNNR